MRGSTKINGRGGEKEEAQISNVFQNAVISLVMCLLFCGCFVFIWYWEMLEKNIE